MSGAATKRTGPTRLLIPAAFASTFVPLYLAPENGWQVAGAVGGGIAVGILLTPWLLRALLRLPGLLLGVLAGVLGLGAKKKRKTDSSKK